MLTQSKETRNAWRASQRILDIKVTIDGKTYGATDINSLKYDSGAYNGDTFAIGSTYSNTVQIEFSHLIEGLKLGMEVRPSIGIKTSSGYVYEPLGVFIISSEIKMDRNNNLTTVSASDRFCGLEGGYVSKLTYPAKVLDVIAEICAQSGVKANTDDLARLPHQADLPAPITGQSYRKALGWIAQLYVGYALFDRQGLFTIRTISEPNYELDPSQYEQAGLTKNEAAYKINGIQCQVTITTKTRDGESTEETKTYQAGDATGSQIKLENNIMTPQRLNDIWEQLKDLTFYPFSLNWFGNPAVEAGDWLRLEDKQGNSFVVPNSSYTLDFNGGLSATSKADQTTSSDQMVPWQGNVAQTIKELKIRRSPDGTVVFPPSVTEPPANAKFNDVWFKKNGNSTELWIFEKQDDGSGKWIRKDLSDDEIKKKVADAQQGLNQAKADIISNKQKADADIENLNKSIEDNKKVADESLQKLNDSVTNLQGQYDNNVVPNLNKVMADASDALQKYISAQNSIADLTKQAQEQGKDIADVTNTVKGLNINYANLAGDVSSTKVDVKGLQTTIGTANGDIAQLKLDAQNLQTMLAGKVDNTTYTNFVNLTNQALNARLTASDLNGYAKTVDVQATANGLRVDLNAVTGKLNNMIVGNRNLIRNSAFPTNTDYWESTAEITTHIFYYQGKKNLFVINNSSTDEKVCDSARFPVKRNTDYVFSFKGFMSWNVSSYDVWFLARKNGETSQFSYSKPIVSGQRLSNGSLQYVKDIVFNSGDNDEAYIRFDNNGSNDGKNSVLCFGEIQLEEGNKSTAWNAAPEDEKQRVDDIASQLSARITANSQQFSSYYTKVEADNKTNSAKEEAKSNAVNAIKSEGNWQGLNNILTNSGFLQTADGFLQKVQQTTQPMIDANNGGGINLVGLSGFHNISVDQLRSRWAVSDNVSINAKGGRNQTGSIVIDARATDTYREITQTIDLEPDTDYRLSFHLLFVELNNKDYSAYTYLVEKDSSGNNVVPYRDSNRLIANTDDRNKNSFIIHTSTSTSKGILYIRANPGTKIELEEVKLEKGRVSTPWSPAPADFATQIKFTELSQSLDGLRSTVGSNYGDLLTQISQSSSAVRTELTNKITGVQNQITTTANGLDAKIAGIRVGGRNLIQNSNASIDRAVPWENTTLQAHSFYYNGTKKMFVLQTNSKNELTSGSNWFKIKPGQKYTFSFWGFQSWNMSNYDVWLLLRHSGENGSYDSTYQIVTGERLSNGNCQKVTRTFTAPDGYDEAYIRLDNNGSNDGNNAVFFFNELKLEEGTIATDWSPAPEDDDKAFAALNVTIDGLKSTISGNYGDLKNQITQTNQTTRNEIDDKVKGLQGQLTLQANNFNVSLNNLQIGGTNLIRNSGNFQNTNYWTLDSWGGQRGQLGLGKHGFWKNNQENLLEITNYDVNATAVAKSSRFNVKPSTTYTLSFNGFHDVNLKSYTVYFLGRKYNSSNDYDVVVPIIAGSKLSASQSTYVKVQFNTGNSDEGYIRFDSNGILNSGMSTLYLADIKVEEGDKATAWSPAPEDQVAKDQILAQINMSAGTTLIQNNKIYMDASSTIFSGNAFIPSAAITSLNADKITAGTINGAKVNVINLNANNITAGTLKGSNGEFYLDSGSLHVWQGDHNAWIDKNGIHDSDNSGNNVWISNGSISAYGNSSGAYLFDGGLYLHKSQSLSDAVLNPNYGSITKSDNIVSFGTSGLDIDGKDGFLLRTHGWNDQTLAYLNGNEIIGAGIAGKSDGFMNIAAKKQLFLYAGEPVQNDKLKTIPKLVLDGTYQNGQTALKGTFSQYFFQGPSSGFSGGITLQDEFVNVGSLNGKNYFSISNDGAISITANGKSILSLNGLFPGVNGDFNVSGNFTVTGSKNAVVPTSRGMAAINAYETAEYYFGDIGETQTNSNGVVTVMIDPYFLETVNTLVPYQVFLTSYGDGNVWVSSRSANNFTVKSSKPNIHFVWEIKAKRKGYENDRMKIVKGVFNNEQY
ncbi:hypothetical protein HHK02_00060 [Limosilactobacillus reuteri]|uniref:Peptidase S74 domain-containing protein n=1 Tax=Limosilactobacillus reuteri TaxID=1598 RepID=A0A7L6BIU3_LIMRT|nr:hypothetical protein [Limosilactobacillus reuteri]QLQ61770.1 hypothetical protein HHK02_00060 [Limosilactobacillus reuteri]